MILYGTPSSRILIDSSASTIQAYLVLCFRILRRGRLLGFTKFCCCDRNFQLSTSSLHCTFEFFILRFNEEDTTQSFGIIELWFLDGPFCFVLLFAASDICFHISGHTLSGLEVVCFLVSLLPDHENLSGGLSFNKMNLVKPVHASDNSLSPSTVQKSSMCFSSNASR